MDAISDLRAPFRARQANRKTLLYFCLSAAFPVYWASYFYIRFVSTGDTEILAGAASVAFFLFTGTGWLMAETWLQQLHQYADATLKMLGAVIVFCFIFLLVHADIQLHGKPAINLMLFWLPFIVLGCSIGIALQLFAGSITMKLRRAQAQATQSQSELQLLQSQISPHFLFNTLNNMYGIALTEHQKIPSLLLKLSDLLRYSVYEAKEPLVPLKHEIDYLKNYIDFEKIRIGDRLELICELEPVTDEQIKVAPMLLIVYIENAFKHAKNTTDQKILVQISLKTWNGVILFNIKNTYSQQQRKTFDKHSGLGLVNAKRRLEVLYPNQHVLHIEANNNIYNVNLQLKTNGPASV